MVKHFILTKHTPVDEIIGDARTKDCIVGGF